ncbi:hypothetical protein ERJ75_001052700 [Trypanosoma vivax]|nr:hypothetical protein ERJ75_001052700 [Trypanosoma vivax]
MRNREAAVPEMWMLANEGQKALMKRKGTFRARRVAQKCGAMCDFTFDAGLERRPEIELPMSEWGCVVLPSPFKGYYECCENR